MSYGAWGERKKDRDSRAFHDKAYRRKDLAAWDAKWHGLSPAARLAFLDEVKGPVKAQSGYTVQPSVGVDKFPARVLKELVDAGFVEARTVKLKAKARVKSGDEPDPDRVFASEATYDFAARVRAIRRFHLLGEGPTGDVAKYIDTTCYSGEVTSAIAKVLQKAGIDDYVSTDVAIGRYIVHRRWPGWVARSMKGPLGEKVIERVKEAGGPVPIVDLAGKVKGSPEDVRDAIDRLVAHLALAEDLDPTTWDIVVGLLPTVREEMAEADKPRVRPPLEVVEAPRVFGPEGSFYVDDLRAFLLEIAGEPPRLRQDKAFFQKEVDRFLDAFDPLPAWLTETMDWSIAERLEQAHAWARMMKLVEESAEGKQVQLVLSGKGEKWLAGPLDSQYTALFELLRTKVGRNDIYDPAIRFFYKNVFDPYSNHGPGDFRFLGDEVSVLKKSRSTSYYWESKPEDIEAFRESLYRGFAPLKAGVYYGLERVVDHVVFGDHNPLLLGLAQEEVVVYRDGQKVPPLEELREEAGRGLLRIFIGERLIPLGCFQTARDAAGKLSVARTPRLDAYFGRKVAKADLAGASDGESRVVVQPDFSVVVIGLNPAPAAALAPFCERSTKGGGQGAMVLKLTRESVVKAVAQGLTPKEILGRLRAHASNEIPTNVLRQVEDWSGWVRRVTLGTMTVLRCPDPETADRVAGALKKAAERISPTLVGVDRTKLTTVERAKLKDQGIIVQGSADSGAAKKKAAKKKSPRYY